MSFLGLFRTKRARLERYIFGYHSRAEISRWAPQLEFFRFCKAYGQREEEGMSLIAALSIRSEQELVDTLVQLELPVLRVGEPVALRFRDLPPGRETFRSGEVVREYPTILQPDWILLRGFKTWIRMDSGVLKITLSDERDIIMRTVSASVVAAASKIEVLLRPMAERMIDPPQDDPYCICPKFYPKIWDN